MKVQKEGPWPISKEKPIASRGQTSRLEQKIAVATRQGRQPEQKDGIAEIVVLRLIEQIIKGVDQKDQNLNLIC